MKPQKNIDRIGLENEFRTVQLSNVAIATLYNITETAIREKGKKDG